MYSSTNIVNEIKESFRNGSTLTKLIYINLGVFILVKITYLFFFLLVPGNYGLGGKSELFQDKYLSYLMVPSDVMLFTLGFYIYFLICWYYFGLGVFF